MNNRCMRYNVEGHACDFPAIWKLHFSDTPKTEWFCSFHVKDEIVQRGLVKIERYMVVSKDKLSTRILTYAENTDDS